MNYVPSPSWVRENIEGEGEAARSCSYHEVHTFMTESVVLREMGSWSRRKSALKSFHASRTLYNDGLELPSRPSIP